MSVGGEKEDGRDDPDEKSTFLTSALLNVEGVESPFHYAKPNSARDLFGRNGLTQERVDPG